MYQTLESGRAAELQQPKFPLGRIVATPGALAQLEDAGISPLDLLGRHVVGDWGELPPEDAQSNELALKAEGRLLSSYPISANRKIWIITEWDRSVTTLLRPEDY